jgi:predicted transcriptional regulator of viral defense system
MEKEMIMSGVMKTQEIMESQSYYGIKKAVEEGSVVRLKKGVYASAEALADTMIDIERVVPKGVLCLYSAWAHYGLTTQIPGAFFVAVEKHRKVVVPEFPPITLCYWDQKYYEMGVVEAEVSGHKVRIYDLEKSVCDAVKFRNKIGLDVATEVVKAYLGRKGRNISRLMAYARQMRVASTLKGYLEIGL